MPGHAFPALRLRPANRGAPAGHGWGLAMVAGVTAAGGGLGAALDLGDVALLYLLPVMAAASLWGLGPGLTTGVAASLAYNFFFLPPLYTLRVGRAGDLVSLVILLGVAVATSQIAARAREADTARERDRLRAALLASVGHDLRTPLTSVLAAAAELRREREHPLLGVIEREAARLDRFVANLLDMARVEAGALRPRAEPVDLTDAIGAAVDGARRTLEGRAIAIEVPPDLPLVSADPQLLHHILLNLLDNAGRHGAPGGPVAIRAAREGSALTLAVLDEGTGLPPGVTPLETFRRIAGSDRGGGTGLGLGIVSGFAEAMGIGVAAANRADPPGACFTLRFPPALLIATERAP